MTYKKGDRVRCVDATDCRGRLTDGKDYKVVGASPGYVRIICNFGQESGWLESRFESSPAARQVNLNGPFVVGDVVDVVNLCSRGPNIGQRVTLTHADSYSAGIGSTRDQNYQNDRFRLAVPTGGFKAGDLVELVNDLMGSGSLIPNKGGRYVVQRVDNTDTFISDMSGPADPRNGWYSFHFRIISRPDADGWHAWTGGENPVPGMWVNVALGGDKLNSCRPSLADIMDWSGSMGAAQVTAYKIVEKPKAVEIKTDYDKIFGKSGGWTTWDVPFTFSEEFAFTPRVTFKPLKDPEPAPISVGDELTVRVKVQSVSPDDPVNGPLIGVASLGYTGPPKTVLTVSRDEIVDHTLRPLKVGDVVCDGCDEGKIVHIKGDDACVDFGEVIGIEIAPLEDLKRAA